MSADSEIERLPVDPWTNRPIPPKAQPGYYPGYSTLDQAAFWDQATRDVVLQRVQEVPPMRFFTGGDEPLFRAIVNTILPQDDRGADHKIPLAEMMDKSIHEGKIHGYRYENMPPMQQAWRLGLQAISALAWYLHGRAFVELNLKQQDEVMLAIREGDTSVPEYVWSQMASNHFWAIMIHSAVESYYAHPWAWDEIGFGGPAYPRPYFRLERGEPEPWEVDEQRYEWEEPPQARSGGYHSMSGDHPHKSHTGGGAGATF